LILRTLEVYNPLAYAHHNEQKCDPRKRCSSVDSHIWDLVKWQVHSVSVASLLHQRSCALFPQCALILLQMHQIDHAHDLVVLNYAHVHGDSTLQEPPKHLQKPALLVPDLSRHHYVHVGQPCENLKIYKKRLQ
jgi:hypothetical protein